MPGPTLVADVDRRTLAAALDTVERAARAGGLPEATVDRVVLVAGEAIANAVDHGRGRVTVSWQPEGPHGHLRLSGDPGPDAGALGRAALPDEAAMSGRGLFLIATLSDAQRAGPGYLDLSFSVRAGEF